MTLVELDDTNLDVNKAYGLQGVVSLIQITLSNNFPKEKKGLPESNFDHLYKTNHVPDFKTWVFCVLDSKGNEVKVISVSEELHGCFIFDKTWVKKYV